ncbi:restriction endonuclease subunit S [Escherichia coli]|uniref:Restriction endonuclease subunit S n=1 Tax=Escherichia coli TaxID=562 RepID=A0A5B9AQJ4_ECOLX|nr:restriction endonuclease subunit S [Escherichia coli]EFM2096438.1 restriction endonuclease subunit S [Escherichia coli]EFM2134431.1 restriction endonuclease subunit S [Escherichia coli]EFO7788415.1 restriction endonuclease subunit S [Escherichia coli]EHR8213910.1 restriction endonuclease subunit S [Escherichia coli]EIF6362121.1 restriction endonuclease subunit S [Escherichia coli]
MSEMSYLEKLLDGVEVEWKSLGDVVNFQRGRRLVKSQLETRGKYAVYQNSMTPLGYYHEYNVAAQSSFIICAGAAGEIGYSENEFWAADDVHFAITPEYINDRFLFHFLLTQKNKISGQVRRASIPRLSKSVIEKLEFPIPCPDNPEKSLAIQSEIVRILDKFTALTAELTAELNMRKKQYNYYRDQLLSFKEGEIEWKTLEEVLVDKFWIMPATPKFDDNGEIPYVTSKNISGGNIDFERVKHISRDDFLSISKNRPILKGDFLISMIGTIGEIARVKCLDPDFYGQNMYLIRLNEELLNPRYFLHFFDSPRMKFYFKSVKNNSGQGYLKANNIDGLSIPLPSIDEQQKIAFILDKFDTLTNSITEGLPREIELRQKQYEYYRDLLFSFPKPETVSN